jgi:hypothetical protein
MTTAANEFVVVFDQPNTPLSLNQAYSWHWSKRKRHLDQWRLALRIAYTKAIVREELPVGPMNIHFTFTFPRNARRDPHNYAATEKPLLDELVQLGLIPDDTAEWVTMAEPTLRIANDNLCLIRISLRETK